ncbi:MAG: CRISPR system precrRNA processing endoribonuclease RAMP protein Cas6, partial [Anaerolineae bacterium]|nr:CRISPR system precrRNA processing endoribonuclease RAMP protein Cas6 [Anaerolineae bacterium]
YQVLSRNFCSEPNGPQTPGHYERCPVCWLLAAEHRENGRGQDTPRPLTVEPPVEVQTFRPGEPLAFGYTLIGQAQTLLPFLARAVQKMGQTGLGMGRGRFRLVGIGEYTPLSGEERALMEGVPVVSRPVLAITPTQIEAAAQQYTAGRLQLELVTPLRLTAQGQLVKQLEPVVFIQRLVERAQNLAEHYALPRQPVSREDWAALYRHLSGLAADIRVDADNIVWREAWSGSRRQNRYLPIGGLVGVAYWSGINPELLPWLLWGQSLHVGKNAVKGDGWYTVRPA